MWVKFWKTWRNGGYAETYRYFPDEYAFDDDKEMLKDEAEAWADSTYGG